MFLMILYMLFFFPYSITTSATCIGYWIYLEFYIIHCDNEYARSTLTTLLKSFLYFKVEYLIFVYFVRWPRACKFDELFNSSWIRFWTWCNLIEFELLLNSFDGSVEFKSFLRFRKLNPARILLTARPILRWIIREAAMARFHLPCKFLQ